MRLTRFTDYSLRVLIYLAASPERRATIAEIAAAFDIKQNHLTKVVQFLGQEGFVATLRGKGGGLMLKRAAQAIIVGDVVRKAEGTDLPAECFDRTNNTCSIARICRLRKVLQRATDAFYAVLDECTLAELSTNGRAIALTLGIGRSPAMPTARAAHA